MLWTCSIQTGGSEYRNESKHSVRWPRATLGLDCRLDGTDAILASRVTQPDIQVGRHIREAAASCRFADAVDCCIGEPLEAAPRDGHDKQDHHQLLVCDWRHELAFGNLLPCEIASHISRMGRRAVSEVYAGRDPGSTSNERRLKQPTVKNNRTNLVCSRSHILTKRLQTPTCDKLARLVTTSALGMSRTFPGSSVMSGWTS